MTRKELKAITAKLERKGLIVRTGEFRRNREGKLEPVFIVTKSGKDLLRQRANVMPGGCSEH